MSMLILFVLGAVAGGLAVRVFAAAARRRAQRPHQRDPLYAATRYAAFTHLKRHGTFTLTALTGAVDLPGHTVQRYLEVMEREGLVRRHGHDARSAFYSRP